jgi:hypothetical protein
MSINSFKNWRFITDMMVCNSIISEDYEFSMARSELKTAQSAISRLLKKLNGEGNLEAWIQSKITKAADYIDTVADHMDSGESETEVNEQLKPHKTVEQIAKKHRLNVSFIQKQLDMGAPIEHEHTKDKTLAIDIALQHLDEIPDYYTRLKKMEASAKKEHKKFKDVKETVTIEDVDGNTFLEIVDLIKPDPLKSVVKEQQEEKRYCTLCKKDEVKSDCSYGPKMWEKFSIAQVHPANESYLRIQTRGTTYSILLNWRGKYITSQMFFPQFTRPTKKQVTDEVRKIYPNAIVLSFNPSTKDPTKPLLFTGDANGPKQY